LHHQPTVGAGVVLGSNVFNLAALLGLGPVVAGSIRLHRKVVVFSGTVAMLIGAACLLSVGGQLSAGVGLAVVLVVFVPFVALLGAHRRILGWLGLPASWTAWLEDAIAEEESELKESIYPKRGTNTDTLVAGGALVVVILASVAMERGASSLGVHFAVPEIIVGGLVLAAVTSLPNAVSAIYLARRGRGAAALSTALNSNSLNVTAGLLIPATVIGLARPSASGLLVAGWYVGLTALTLLLAYVGHGFRRAAGGLIIATYALFVVVLLVIS
jgi:cation:H+ antiporter